MWQERADRARREIATLAADGLSVPSLHARAIEIIGSLVPSDLACWATFDPETVAISGMTSGRERLPARFEPVLAAAEYSGSEPHRFASMARRHQVSARLSDLSADERASSLRVNEVWRPLGLSQEIRVLFLVDGACWGAAGMVRTGRDFTEDEVGFLLHVAPAVASATRATVRADLQRGRGIGRPAVAVIGPRGGLRSATAAARDWQERVDEPAPGRSALLMQLMAAGAHDSTGGFRATVQDGQGGWTVLEASPLVGTDGDVAVAIQPASGDDLERLLLAAYGLTPRERDLCQEVLVGRSTREIAHRLAISTNTVQDHLKSVFAKTDVHSRGELAARLRPFATVGEEPQLSRPS